MKTTTIIVILLVIIVGASLVYSLTKEKEPLIGGCGGVAPWYIQECCERWAYENNIFTPACVGFWAVEAGKCSWKCGSPNNEETCLIAGGKWVEEQIGGFLDLNVDSDDECEAWGGQCSGIGNARIISSFDIGKCDDGSACWHIDVFESACLLRANST